MKDIVHLIQGALVIIEVQSPLTLRIETKDLYL